MANGRISFSEWQLWNQCQWRWMRDAREGRRSEINSVHLTFGTCLHKALEALLPPTKSGIQPTTVEEAFSSFEVSFREKIKKQLENEKIDFLSEKEIDGFVSSAKNILTHIRATPELVSAKVLFCEEPLFEDIERSDDVKVKFKGFIDLVIMTKNKNGKSVVWICDYKTCSWGWDRDKRSDEMLHSQLRLYKHFFCKKYKLDPKNVKTAFILLKKRPKDVDKPIEWFPISTGNVTMMRAVTRLNMAVTGMETNNYEKNRKACVGPYGDVCPYMNTDLCTNED